MFLVNFSTTSGNFSGSPKSLTIAFISVFTSPGGPSVLTILPKGEDALFGHSLNSTTTFSPSLNSLSSFCSIKKSV